ncbi:MAG: NUDIX domain-containing protein [Candidatus Saccharimonadales bacterium]|nr:NUDIX domain-containing protein [Candidatus Saccharibacteria bacterium]
MQKIVPNDAVLVPEQATCAFKGEIFDVYQWPQTLFDGSTETFEMLRRPDTTSVICIADGKIIVLDEEQPRSGKRRSFPGGRVDETDGNIIAAAQREVLEETGYTFQHWRVLKVWQPVKKLEWFVHLVLAWDQIAQQDTAHEPGEKISIELLPFDEVKQLAAQGVGFLGESLELLSTADAVHHLTTLPEFQGMTVYR